MKKNTKPPQQFKRQGKSYIGFAIAFRREFGDEVILLAPTREKAAEAALAFGLAQVDIDRIVPAAIVSENALADLVSA